MEGEDRHRLARRLALGGMEDTQTQEAIRKREDQETVWDLVRSLLQRECKPTGNRLLFSQLPGMDFLDFYTPFPPLVSLWDLLVPNKK